MEFRCRLVTPGGEVTEGIYAADDEAHLRQDLEQKGLCILKLQPRRATGRLGLPTFRRQRIPTGEFLVFNQELATLLKAGMPLVQSLDILRTRMAHPVFRSVLNDVHDRVRAGTSLSEAFDVHGELFPGVYTASLLAGEKSGNLDSVLRRYVAYMKVIGAVKRRTVSALVYPTVLITLATIVVGIIVLRVVPAFSDFYASFNAELPLATRAIVGVSDFIRAQFFLLLLGVIATTVSATMWTKRPEQRVRLDRLLLAVPWVGSIARKFATAQLSRTVATLLGGGIPLVNAIEVAARSIGNRHMAEDLEAAGRMVREGQSFSSALAARGVFPSVAVKMAEVGESTGALQEMLTSLADFYDEEIETDLGRFVTIVEPMLLVIMGIIIAALLLALYMPLFQLTSVVS
jgi:type IV pilus assembly protein PilC